MNTTTLDNFDRAAACVAGALAVTEEADRRHLILSAMDALADERCIDARDVAGLLSDVLHGVEPDAERVLKTVRAMLDQACEELDAATA